MRNLRYALGLTVAALLLVPVSAQNLDVELQRATQKEIVSGDLKAAIEEYKKIVARAGTNRPVAAQALVRMAECYQRLGDAEARKIYERVVREFPDRKEEVALARARLGGGAATQNAGVVTRQVWTGPKVDAYGTVSPDGRFLSFTDWDTGDLALHDFVTGQDRRLTNKGTWQDSPAFALLSAISRDGKQVAYEWLTESPITSSNSG